MKKIIILSSVIFSGLSGAQVIIGNTTGTAAVKTAVLLEFANTGNRGLVLPYNTSVVTPTEGSIMLDVSNPTDARVKYYDGSWKDLSNNASAADVSASLTIQNSATQSAGNPTIIGATSTSANGVLVLESSAKAMVLPHVSTTDNIVNPAPGMMVYVDGPRKLVAVYNGSQWSYWE